MTPRIGFRALPAAALLAVVGSVLLAVPAAMPVSLGRDALPGVDAATLWARVRIVGASASAGFAVRAPGGRTRVWWLESMPLAHIGSAARLGAGEVTGDASRFFFIDPEGNGREQVDALLAMDPRPTVVLAPDFLFWFTYGTVGPGRRPVRDEAERLALLAEGLRILDRVGEAGIPLVVGDLPDMSAAVGKMLSRAQMPARGTIERANEEIRAWAARRPRVALLPLGRLVSDLRSGKPFQAGRRTWDAAVDGALIQRDDLHPTFEGSVALLARAEQAANDRFLGARQPNAPGAPAAFE
ncbi:MAG: hypothetical protein ACKOF7_12940, partial [Phycisphaerales bacterium]